MANIFVSYNRKSEVITKALIDDVKALGHVAWFDQELSGGQAWWDHILENIRNSDVFVFVLNPESLSSSACALEYNYAADLGKTILPVLISEGISTNLLPPALSKIQFVDYQKQDRDAVLRLAKAITNIPPPQPLPNPLPASPEVPISYLGSFTVQVETNSNLSYEEQSALLVNLKRSFRDPETTDDTRTLLERLRIRHDLFATIAEEIDELLRSTVKKTVVSPQASKTERLVEAIEKENKAGPFSRSPLLLWLFLAAYISFTVVLLSSGSSDREYGLWFVGNLLILVVGSVASYLGKISTSKICGIGVIGQIIVLTGHHFIISVNEVGMIINLTIAGALLGMMILYAKKERKQKLV